jgi:hypothetical protein
VPWRLCKRMFGGSDEVGRARNIAHRNSGPMLLRNAVTVGEATVRLAALMMNGLYSIARYSTNHPTDQQMRRAPRNRSHAATVTNKPIAGVASVGAPTDDRGEVGPRFSPSTVE